MSEPAVQPTIADIRRVVAEHFGVRPIDMTSHRLATARPRQIAMYIARTLTESSLPMIGRHFGNRDHTTVMHACRVIEKLVASDTRLASDVAIIEARLLDPNQLLLPLAAE